jgi:Lrp/AsnC family transcriptional regulator for asnA, asnC and gidA
MDNLKDKDQIILKELQRDSNRTYDELAEATKLKTTTVHNRVRKLIERGIIKKYTIIPDHERIGKGYTGHVLINFELIPNFSLETISQELKKISDIVDIYVTSGRFDMVIKTRTKDQHELHEIINKKLLKINGIGKTETLTTFESYKEEYL